MIAINNGSCRHAFASGMNSISPGTDATWPACQSALARSMPLFELKTKFCQITAQRRCVPRNETSGSLNAI